MVLLNMDYGSGWSNMQFLECNRMRRQIWNSILVPLQGIILANDPYIVTRGAEWEANRWTIAI